MKLILHQFEQLPTTESSFLSVFEALRGLALHGPSSGSSHDASHVLHTGLTRRPSVPIDRELHCLYVAHASLGSSSPPSLRMNHPLTCVLTPLFRHKIELFII